MWLKVFVCVLTFSAVNGQDHSYFSVLTSVNNHIPRDSKQNIEPFRLLNSEKAVGLLQHFRPENVKQYADDYKTFLTNLEESVSNTSQSPSLILCLNDTIQFFQSLSGGEPWTSGVVDALGKIPSGLLYGNAKSLGSYDECLNVRGHVYADPIQQTGEIRPFNGQYCTANLPFKSPLAPQGAVFTLGLCVSDRCSSTDLNVLIQMGIQLANATSLKNVYAACQKNHLELDGKAISAIVFVAVFGCLLVVSTMVDIVSEMLKNFKIEGAFTSANGDVNLTHKIGSEETPLLGKQTAEVKHVSSEPGCMMKFFLAFSVYTNGKKLLTTTQPSGTLNAINGIRFLSMSWVILGHSSGFAGTFVSNIGYIFPLWIKRRSFQAILNALVSVDSFFTLSGLLLTYLVLKQLKRNEGKLNWALFYFHRFWRLTPPLMFVMWVYVPLFQYYYDGPMWPQKGTEPNKCSDSWWKNMIYINNFGDALKSCMGWTWYLANDMQFFVVSPIILLPLYYSPAVGFLVLGTFLFGTWIATGLISNTFHLPPALLGGDPTGTSDYFAKYYIKPYCRMGPYLMGMVAGYFLYKTDCKQKIHKLLNLLIWAVAATLACLIVYGLYDNMNGSPLSQPVADLYNTTHRTVWGACVAWVAFACATGNGGFVNTILSWKPFIPLSRLTYCAYLVHPIIMYTYYSSMRSLIYMNDVTNVYLFLSNLVISYMAAFCVSLAFESPMMGLEKIIFKRASKRE